MKRVYRTLLSLLKPFLFAMLITELILEFEIICLEPKCPTCIQNQLVSFNLTLSTIILLDGFLHTALETLQCEEVHLALIE